jgi:hypothetical protein
MLEKVCRALLLCLSVWLLQLCCRDAGWRRPLAVMAVNSLFR